MADLGFLASDWPAISQRLDEALALAPAQRDRWLAALDETDTVKDSLRQLLADAPDAAAGVETDDFAPLLPQLTLGPDAPQHSAAGAAAVAGAVIGPYRLIRELGVGGMGVVWLAERSDGGLKRQVALKLPHMSWTRGLAERMSRERDILASLDHPNIARIHDAGVDPQGRPYLALEYVDGIAIDAYCSQHALSVAQRLRLVVQVARALSHAHARLVVHRDLKPANILVTAEGQVRLLDFGIAKLLDGASAEETQLTRQVGRVLTLDYASPEQIRGEPIGTASDVYSLGVVTYQLLTGAKPYRLKHRSAAALEEAIATVDVRPASAAATDPAVRRRLRGDLDAILQRALKKDVVARYPSADAFAADIERHLARLPVSARPDSAGYRLGRFVRRHRWPVALGSVTAAVLVASLAAVLWQARAAEQQRDRALTLLSRNEAIVEFLQLFVLDAAASDRPLDVAEMLKRSEAMVDQAVDSNPEERAIVLHLLGSYQRTLGDVERADELLRRSLESARHLGDPSLEASIACSRADVLGLRGQVDAARRELRAILARKDLDDAVAVGCYRALAYLGQASNDGPTTVDSARQMLRLLQASRGAPMMRVANANGILAYGLHLSGRNDEANREFAKTVALYDKAGRAGNAVAISVRNNWGIVSIGAGDVGNAVRRYDEVLALLAANRGGEAPAYVLSNRARALELMGRYDEANAGYAAALASAQKQGNAPFQAYALLGLASTALEQGRLPAARDHLGRVERLDAAARPAGGPIARAERLVRGRAALAAGDLAGARREFEAVLQDRQPNRSTFNALLGRAEVAAREGQLGLAAQDAQEALAQAQAQQGGVPYSVATGSAWLLLGELQARTGDAAAAKQAYRTAVDHLSHTADASLPALQRARRLAGADPN